MDEIYLLILIVLKALLVIVPLLGAVAYYTLLERKVIGYMQARVGPNRTGVRGIGQPIADALKLMFKELLIPTKSNKFIFVIAPILSLAPAISAWAVVPFADNWVVADINGSSFCSLLAIVTRAILKTHRSFSSSVICFALRFGNSIAAIRLAISK